MARRWHPSEDAVLAHLYAQGIPLRVIVDRLGRSADALDARRKLLDIPPRRPYRVWSEAQDMLIRIATEAGIPASKLAQQQHVPVAQLRRRRTELLGAHPPHRPYQPWEDEAIRSAWTSRPEVDALARQLMRSPDAIRLRASALGIHRPPSRARWTRIEDQALRQGYADGLSCAEISSSLSSLHSVGSVAARARKLGLTSYARRWTREEETRLRRLVTTGMTIDEIALALARTPERVRKLGADLPIARPHPRAGKPWTAADDAVLRQSPGAHPSRLGSILGRSDHAIRRRQAALQLRCAGRSPHHAPAAVNTFAPAEDGLLQRELGGVEGPEGNRLLALSDRLGRSPGELRRHLGHRRLVDQRRARD